MNFSRRRFISTAATGTMMATLAPGVRAAFSADSIQAGAPRDIVVAIFLRFGCDGLTMVAPAEDANYRASRPTIGVTSSGARAGLHIGGLDGVPFFMNPSLPEMKALYDSGKLAVVHAAGLPTHTRSHFESQNMMERGVVESDGPVLGGWLARHLKASNLALPDLGAVASASVVQASLRGWPGSVAVPDVTDFNVTGGDFNLKVIEALNAGAGAPAASARATADMIRSVKASVAKLSSADGSVAYPLGGFSAAMRSLANVVKMKAGLEVATVDFGGWDHHYNMNLYFPPAAGQLSQSLAAFWADLEDFQDRLTIVTMTEFGRRLEENTAGGADHGAASVMFVLGGAVKGGRIYGQWPGLKESQLREGDLSVTTDVRNVLQEILVNRRGETPSAKIFPSLSYAPLGIVRRPSPRGLLGRRTWPSIPIRYSVPST
ncbi:MAG: DUF1501 domain-containing protein [Rhodospirillaceae bacterium]|nr:DUF1501 domain-containing protein [Rhodospirillaceae bacterium]